MCVFSSEIKMDLKNFGIDSGSEELEYILELLTLESMKIKAIRFDFIDIILMLLNFRYLIE